ncbi:hypothetical protein [Sphingomonas sp. LR55]|uniref:hypothetical protein n=1 Tax=Sphingomonas sp. LR55 TaxID=3050231 RepID=UPI002FE3E557
MNKAEFSRPERLDTIGERERIVEIVANEDERAALAKRFAMVSIARLEARFGIKRTDSGIVVKGRVTGAAVQACSVTDEPLDTRIDEPVALLFVEQLVAEGDEVELSDDALDTVAIEGARSIWAKRRPIRWRWRSIRSRAGPMRRRRWRRRG